MGERERGGAFLAALKICLKREFLLHYHRKHIENDIFIANFGKKVY
jgi:hypothetical protein